MSKMGRPPRPYRAYHKHFYLPDYICSLLDREDNQNLIVTKAVELYYKNIEASDQYLLKRKDELLRELESIDNTIQLKQNKDLQLKKFQSEYNDFIKFLESDGKLNNQTYNSIRTNEHYKTNIKDRGHFLKLQKKHSEGSFSIDDYKELIK